MGISTQGGGLVNGSVNQGRGDGSMALSNRGGETGQRHCPPKEGRLFDGAVHPVRKSSSTGPSIKGGETVRRGYPPKEGRRVNGNIHKRRGAFDGAFHQKGILEWGTLIFKEET